MVLKVKKNHVLGKTTYVYVCMGIYVYNINDIFLRTILLTLISFFQKTKESYIMYDIYNPIICYFLIMGNNICQSDWYFSWSGFTIARKFWPIKEEKGEPSLKWKLTTNPLPPFKKKDRKIIFIHLVPFWNASHTLIFFPMYTILKNEYSKRFYSKLLSKDKIYFNEST